MSKVRSAKGEDVDFDLLKIKAQMAASPKTTSVQAREDFIDRKFKRRLRKLKRDVVVTQAGDVTVEPTEAETETPDTPETE